ncbi:glucose-repressible alcohol dehydrogenase-like protein transcriptional effector [Cryomyces antarcticus]
MADGPYRFQQGAGQYYYPQHNPQTHHPRHLQQPRNQSPVNSSRVGFGSNNDTPSPNRSPGPNSSPAHNPYSMYNSNHQQSRHGIMNGTSHQQFNLHMNMAKQFQHPGHQQQGHHQNQQHQDHTGHNGHVATFGNHQHNVSTGGLSNAAPHFTPARMQNGTPNNVQNGLSKPPNDHWATQMHLAQQSREATQPHHYARNANTSKTTLAGGQNGVRQEADREERNRATKGDAAERQQIWMALDFGGQGLKSISPALFDYSFLDKLYLNFNKLSYLSPSVGRLRSLTHLDLSQNELRELPAEIGMLVNLRTLLLFDNQLETLPYEMGALYQLEVLGVDGNPLHDEFKNIIVEHGTGELIRYLREQAQDPDPPSDRDWIVLDDTPSSNSPQDKITALSYNTLCDKYATQAQYGYTPSRALAWEHRREVLLDEIRARDADFVCLQEIDQHSYNEYFRGALAHNDYKGVYFQKIRARTMQQKDADFVDGCVTFYKNSKYILLDKQLINFTECALDRKDLTSAQDVFNRVMPRDDIAVLSFYENRVSGARLMVVNAHLFWDPQFKDVKVVQAALLMDHVTNMAEKYAKWPACTNKTLYRYANGEKEDDGVEEEPVELGPSLKYSSGADIPLIMCGDFNSKPDSGVYDLIAHGSLPHDHPDLMSYTYGKITGKGTSHPFSLKSSYSNIGELPFTNYTPGFTGVIDYIWYSSNAFQATGLLGEVDPDYLKRVPGFPNYHFPSDHLALLAEFVLKSKKEKKTVEADFGPQRDRRA